ncbi:hypothetical protein ACVW0J_009179 [Bradyrhizobium sp. i1.7.7]
MTYATVMVSLALDQPNNGRLQVAGELAERFEAAIVGVAAAQFARPLYFADAAEARADRPGARSIRKRLTDLEAQFRAATKARGRQAAWISPRGLSWRRCGAPISSQRRAQPGRFRCLFARKPQGSGDAGRPAASGRARRGQLAQSAQRARAWKDTAEERRAVADALPMLRKAKDITMLEIPEDDDDGSVAMARGTNVAAWLARHGVTATARVTEAAGNEPAAVQLEKIAGRCRRWLDRRRRLRSFAFPRADPRRRHPYLVTQSARCVLLSH